MEVAFGKLAEVRLVQSEKALSPTEVTAGKLAEVRLVQR
jgi:hypothetical protein